MRSDRATQRVGPNAVRTSVGQGASSGHAKGHAWFCCAWDRSDRHPVAFGIDAGLVERVLNREVWARRRSNPTSLHRMQITTRGMEVTPHDEKPGGALG
jgi:hypothetical protein